MVANVCKSIYLSITLIRILKEATTFTEKSKNFYVNLNITERSINSYVNLNYCGFYEGLTVKANSRESISDMINKQLISKLKN